MNHHSNLPKTEPNLEPYYGSKKINPIFKGLLIKTKPEPLENLNLKPTEPSKNLTQQ